MKWGSRSTHVKGDHPQNQMFDLEIRLMVLLVYYEPRSECDMFYTVIVSDE